jgi:cell division protein FtsQ
MVAKKRNTRKIVKRRVVSSTTKKRNTRKTRTPVRNSKASAFFAHYTRWLAFLLLPFTLLLLIWSINYWLSDPSNLVIQRVQVDGDFNYADREKVSAIIRPFIKTNLHLLDMEALEAELEFEPWVLSVAITKVWPDKVWIEVVEQVPIAFWGDDRLLNSYGDIFDASMPEKKGEIPVLFHPDNQGAAMIEKYVNVQKWLSALPQNIGISEFKESERGAWQLKLTNGLVIEVGNANHKKRLKRFVVGYTRVLLTEVNKLRKIDLRYSNGFAVSWK